MKLEIKGHRGNTNSRLYMLLDLLIFNGTAKTKLAMMSFLYYGEFVKNSNTVNIIVQWKQNCKTFTCISVIFYVLSQVLNTKCKIVKLLPSNYFFKYSVNYEILFKRNQKMYSKGILASCPNWAFSKFLVCNYCNYM